MTERAVGEVLDALDLVMDLEPGEHVTDVLVFAKVVPLDAETPTPRIEVTSSRASDWITCLGLARAGYKIVDESEPTEPAEDDDR